MYKTSKKQVIINVVQEFESENYEEIMECADRTQTELIHDWQTKNKEELKYLILASRNVLNFWIDSIAKNKLWTALVRCGAWIGTLETIERSIYEENMDQWLQKRISKKISSIKHLPEILHLLEVRGVMTHSELAEKLNLNYPSTLTEIMKKIADLELIMITKSGKYNLYSLTDAGIRYAKQIRNGENNETNLENIIKEYKLKMSETELDSHLRSLTNEKKGVLIKTGQNIGIITDTNKKLQDMTVEGMMRCIPYNNIEKTYLILKNKIGTVPYEREA